MYTQKDLEKVRKIYTVIYDKLVVTVDTKEHEIWVKREKRVFKINNIMLKQLGIELKNLCPKKKRSCKNCNGVSSETKEICKFKPTNKRYRYTRVLEN